MSRLMRARMWWQSKWGATLAGFGIRRSRTQVMAFRWGRPGPEPDFSKFRPPIWARPDDELGVAAGTRAVLVSTERLAVALVDCVGYSNGFEFTIAYRTRDKLPLRRPGPMEEMSVRIVYPDGAVAGSGRDAMNAHYEAFYADAKPPLPKGPIVMPQGGGGTETHYDMSFWCWPLPPDGRMTMTFEWSVGRVPATTVEVDASAIHRAGVQSKKLWS